jgi:hypothetical protein
MTDPITGNQSFVPGSLKTPPGLAPRWSTNGGGSHGTTEPASGVNAVGASGTSVDGSTGGQAQSQPPTGGFAAPNAGGDGWEALFIGANVYNVHHHAVYNAVNQIDCHVKSTGATCPGYPATYVFPEAGRPLGTGPNTLLTSFNPAAAVAGTKIYFPAGGEQRHQRGCRVRRREHQHLVRLHGARCRREQQRQLRGADLRRYLDRNEVLLGRRRQGPGLLLRHLRPGRVSGVSPARGRRPWLLRSAPRRPGVPQLGPQGPADQRTLLLDDREARRQGLQADQSDGASAPRR